MSEEKFDLSSKVQDEFGATINSPYTKKKVHQYMEKLLESSDMAYSKDIGVENDMTYILSMFAVIAGSDRDSFYRIEPTDDIVVAKNYKLPSVRFIRKKVR